MDINYRPSVEEYLLDLIEILYNKEYFGFEQTAHEYVEKMVDYVKTAISSGLVKKAPAYFNALCYLPS